MRDSLTELAECLGRQLEARGWSLVTAESCTGGGIAEAITRVPGSSAWFERGFVSYSNQAKVEMLGVSEATLADHGAVSEAVAREMAAGALAHSHAAISVAVTGIAGPGGGTVDKPAGTVWLGWACAGREPRAECQHFTGDRQAVRGQTIAAALAGLAALLEGPGTAGD